MDGSEVDLASSDIPDVDPDQSQSHQRKTALKMLMTWTRSLRMRMNIIDSRYSTGFSKSLITKLIFRLRLRMFACLCIYNGVGVAQSLRIFFVQWGRDSVQKVVGLLSRSCVILESMSRLKLSASWVGVLTIL